MKIVKGIYQDGMVKIEPDSGLEIEEKKEVYVLLPDHQAELGGGDWKSFPAGDLKKIDNLVSLGGDSLKDLERIYED
jgi:hypothetical protein